MKTTALTRKYCFMMGAMLLVVVILAAAAYAIRGYTTTALLTQVGVVAGVFLSAVVAGYLFLQRYVNAPLSRLLDYSNKLVEHDYSATLDLHSHIEFDAIAGAMQYIAIDLQSIFANFEEAVVELEKNRLKLQDTLGHLTAIIENIADGLLVTDTEGTVERVNHTLLTMFGLREEDVLKRHAGELFQSEMGALIDECRSAGRGVAVSAEVKLRGGRDGLAMAAAVYQRVDDAADDASAQLVQTGVVMLVRDITREKETDRMKTDFISTVSHELRTPLTSILGFARIIGKKLDESIFPLIAGDDRRITRTIQQTQENLQIIVSEGERLTSLINDVLDIAKMEAGRTEWKKEPVSLSEVIDWALNATASLFEQSELTLEKEVEEELPLISGDRDRLIQVVINLISNAVKFSERGTVICRARRSENGILVSVSDSGRGIAAQELQKVFDKFKQVGDTLTDKPKGTGLGLPICRQIIEHHNGRIWAESELGSGSTFSFLLPLPAADQRLEPATIANLTERLREHVVTASPNALPHENTILVVDDDPSIRQLLRQQFEEEGYVVREALNGMDAVKQVKAVPPDLIILDVMMPEMNGFDCAAILKNDPLTMHIPIIILSILEDRERGYRLGVDRYFTKPVDTEQLLSETGQLISQGLSKKKVIIMDENEPTVKSLTEVLEARGFKVIGASSSKDCIRKAIAEKPDMIIIDAAFSDDSGIMQTLRFENGLENIFFVVMGSAPEGRATPTKL